MGLHGRDATGTPALSANVPPDSEWLRALGGRFIVFEGPDGSGKSTALRRLARAAQHAGLTVRDVRDPGGTAVGERIREILLDRAHTGMGTVCETFLYMASRAELVDQIIRPALDRGELVLSDRFVQSTLAYQGAAGGIPEHEIRSLAGFATRGLRGHLVLLFDLDEQAAARRLSPLLDRMEAKGAAFHRAVRQGYLAQARAEPDLFAVLDASRTEDEVYAQMMHALRTRLVDAGPAPRAAAAHAGAGRTSP